MVDSTIHNHIFKDIRDSCEISMIFKDGLILKITELNSVRFVGRRRDPETKAVSGLLIPAVAALSSSSRYL